MSAEHGMSESIDWPAWWRMSGLAFFGWPSKPPEWPRPEFDRAPGLPFPPLEHPQRSEGHPPRGLTLDVVDVEPHPPRRAPVERPGAPSGRRRERTWSVASPSRGSGAAPVSEAAERK